MILKPVYEVMPYLYLIAGSVIVVTLPGAAIAAGLLLYAFGAWLWLVRSDRRRVNSRYPKSVGSRFFWGDTLYELQPFLYILLGVLVVGLLQHDLRLLMGPLMVLTGMVVLMVRHSERKKPPQRLVSVPAKACRNTELKRELGLDHNGQQRANDLDLIHLFDTTQSRTADNYGQAIDHQPHAPSCDICQIEDICQSVKLDRRSVQEVMRLSQTVAPDEAFELYRQAVQRIEGRRVSDDELKAVLNLLYNYSDHCVTWRRTGRLAAY